MADHKYKLTYFKARGAGEISRLLFKAAGKEFTDERVEGEGWQKIKDGMPLKALPVLEVDGKTTACQSHAIARYLAREFGFMGSNNIENLRIEELEETLVEMFQREIIKIFTEKDENKKKELATEFEKDKLQVYLDFVEKRLKQNNDGKGFYVGDKLTYADLLIYDGFTLTRSFLGNFGVDPLKNRPLLQAHFDRVGAQPNIAAWVKSRPKTDF